MFVIWSCIIIKGGGFASLCKTGLSPHPQIVLLLTILRQIAVLCFCIGSFIFGICFFIVFSLNYYS